MTVSRDLSPVLREHVAHGGQTIMHEFWCPGCEVSHMITVRRAPHRGEHPKWTWNGNAEQPTYTPSILVGPGSKLQCHLFVRDGCLDFQPDCYHTLAGVTNLPMCPLPPAA
jgi:Family of unknown function (DUF6527)